MPVAATDGPVEDGAVDAVKERPVHVCRARLNGLWVPGRLPSNATECHVSLLGRVFSYPQYEVRSAANVITPSVFISSVCIEDNNFYGVYSIEK